MSLSDLGWNAHFEDHFAPHAGDGLVPGRVAVEHRGAYAVYTDDGDRWAELAGRLRHEAVERDELPAVGDWVALQPLPEARAVVQAVLPRRTKFSRTAASDQQRVSAEQATATPVRRDCSARTAPSSAARPSA